MSEPLDFDNFLDNILTKLKEEDKGIKDFGEKYRNQAQAIFTSIPKGTYKNIIVTGEIIDSVQTSNSGPLIFTQKLYQFGQSDKFMDAFESSMKDLGGEIQQEQKDQMHALLDEKLGNLAKYD